jgi:hypothetical protein
MNRNPLPRLAIKRKGREKLPLSPLISTILGMRFALLVVCFGKNDRMVLRPTIGVVQYHGRIFSTLLDLF